MSVLEVALPFLSLAPAMLGAAAAFLTFGSAVRTLKFKNTLRKVALSDRLVTAELVKYYRDRELSDSEVRALVRAIDKAIQRDLRGASGDLEMSLRGARALALEEVETRGHRLFKELAAEASDRSERVA